MTIAFIVTFFCLEKLLTPASVFWSCLFSKKNYTNFEHEFSYISPLAKDIRGEEQLDMTLI